MESLAFHDIVSLDDPRYDDYLDLYQKSFPLPEQELVSRHNRILRARMRGETPAQHLFVAVGPDGRTAGMARYELARRAGLLWYLAVREEARGGGLGTAMYAEVIRRVPDTQPDAAALVYEVEAPEDGAAGETARRRIGFYQRNGGLLLSGVRYVQSVGWQPPLEMCLMVHPLRPLDANQAFALCSEVFGEALRAVDAPGLVGIG